MQVGIEPKETIMDLHQADMLARRLDELERENRERARAIERIGRENRRLKRIGGGFAAVVAVVGIAAGARLADDSIVAEQITLRDKDGNDRIKMLTTAK